MITDGPIFSKLVDEASRGGLPYGEESLNVIKAIVKNLNECPTSNHRPGMLLGMIQGGKTRTFLGVIALAVDNGFDLFIVLTKGTTALTTQTYERLKQAYDTVIDLDELRVFDIMSFPKKLTPREQKIPLLIVAKKENHNLDRLKTALLHTYPRLSERRTLIIDDEADFASVGFKRTPKENMQLQAIMQSIDEVRQSLSRSSFLQVTATPYSLYLQPRELPPVAGAEFRPVRPAFTELVPVYDGYVGGSFYFDESTKPGTVASFVFCPVAISELEVLRQPDRRRFKVEDSLTGTSIQVLRRAIVTFVVGGVVRRLQAKRGNEKPRKYSFIIHTESRRDAHAWQESVIDELMERIRQVAAIGTDRFKELVKMAFDDLSKSVLAAEEWLPSFEDVLQEVEEHLQDVKVEKVNTDSDVQRLLDRDGQLELRNRLTIFIGGQILDRGLTIRNLIGFYYGRRANRFQQDTVLQHSRMYGARPLADLAVTRFYTSLEIHEVLSKIHEFDSALRDAFIAGGNKAGIAFIRKEGSKIVPCSPNKILVSTLTTLKAGKRLLPVGFQTGYKTHILKTIKALDDLIDSNLRPLSLNEPCLIDSHTATEIIDLIRESIEYEADSPYEWDVDAFKASMEYVCNANPDGTQKGKIFLLARRSRDNVRMRESGRFFDAPDTSHVEGRIAREVAQTSPMLMVFRQNGLEAQGWRGCPFWWPVLYMPQQMGTVVFASDVNDVDEDSLSPPKDKRLMYTA